MTKTLDASLVAPARPIKRRTAAKPARRGAFALVEETLRLFMWTVVALFTLLLAVVIALD